ncbi:hypothetical protein ACIA5C_48025 [Actinoplanes sp. NPDC051343]|uniref:hypothetical protein n=1 Tax=Actinoplanes sp. NPDC051343 TaxID=3363906 RepID=UPI00379D3B5B
MNAEELLQDLLHRQEEYARGNHGPALSDEALAHAAELWNLSLLPTGEMDARAAFLVAMTNWIRYRDLPYSVSRGNFLFAIQTFAQLVDVMGAAVPQSAQPYIQVLTVGTPDDAVRMLLAAAQTDNGAALDIALMGLGVAIDDGGPENPALPEWCMLLASGLMIRYDRFGAISDLNVAVAADEQAYELLPPGRPERGKVLEQLAKIWVSRHYQLHEPDALDRLIEVQVRQIAIDPSVDLVAGLATSLGMRFKRSGDPGDAAEAIRLRRVLLERHSPDHPDRWKFESDVVAAILSARPGGEDLDEAINLGQSAERLAPDATSREIVASNLATAYELRFDLTRELDDLSAAIDRRKDPGHRSSLVYRRYQRTGDVDDLRTAAAIAPSVTPADRMMRCSLLIELYQLDNDLTVLDRAVEAAHECAANVGGDQPDLRAAQYAIPGIALQHHFQRTRRLADIDEAIRLVRLALAEDPSADDNAVLGEFFMARFDVSADPADLQAAGEAMERAIAETPPRGPVRARRLLRAAEAFRRLSDSTGSQQALARAIDLFRRAADADELDEDPGRYFDQLGNALQTQYEWTGSTDSLNDAVDAGQHALELSPPGHWDRAGRLTNLGNALQSLVEVHGRPEDARAAVSALSAAIDAATDDDRYLGMYHANLGIAVHSAYRYIGHAGFIEAAIRQHRLAVELTMDMPGFLANYRVGLATALISRDEKGDLDEAIDVLRQARQTAGPQFGTSVADADLGSALIQRYRRDHHNEDAEEALEVLGHAAQAEAAPAYIRLEAARLRAVFIAETDGAKAAADAYRFAVSMVLPDLAIPGVARPDQWRRIERHAGALGPDATAALIDAGRIAEAVEVADRGRNLVWGQLLDLNADVVNLQQKRPDMARRLIATATRLSRGHSDGFEPRVDPRAEA